MSSTQRLFTRGLGVTLVLQVDDHLELAIGLGDLPGRLVRLTKEIVREEIGGVHLCGAVEVMQRLDGLLELEEDLSEKNVGRGGSGLEQHRAIERRLRVGVLTAAQVGV